MVWVSEITHKVILYNIDISTGPGTRTVMPKCLQGALKIMSVCHGNTAKYFTNYKQIVCYSKQTIYKL